MHADHASGIQALVRELQIAPDCLVNLTAAQLLQIISMMQLALRHSDFVAGTDSTRNTRDFAREFIDTMRRRTFDGFPAIQALIDEGDRP